MMQYVHDVVKILRVGTHKIITVVVLQMVLQCTDTHPKDADGMANRLDPDQTAPLGLQCLLRPIYSSI